MADKGLDSHCMTIYHWSECVQIWMSIIRKLHHTCVFYHRCWTSCFHFQLRETKVHRQCLCCIGEHCKELKCFIQISFNHISEIVIFCVGTLQCRALYMYDLHGLQSAEPTCWLEPAYELLNRNSILGVLLPCNATLHTVSVRQTQYNVLVCTHRL